MRVQFAPTEPAGLREAFSDRTVREALAWGTLMLGQSESPRLDAQLLLGHVLRRDRVWLLAHGEVQLRATESEAYRQLIERRTVGEPVAYLRGLAYWRDLELAVGPGVLVPRPETEMLVDIAVGLVRSRRPVADIGTGSGAIAIALAHALPDVRVIAVDVSAGALCLARLNVEQYHVSSRVELCQGQLLEPVEEEPALIVANLPYLSADRMSTLPRDVRFEPQTALYGGPDGLELYRELVRQMVKRGWCSTLVFEIDPEQRTGMEMLLRGAWPAAQIRFEEDLAGRVRAVVCEPNGLRAR